MAEAVRVLSASIRGSNNKCYACKEGLPDGHFFTWYVHFRTEHETLWTFYVLSRPHILYGGRQENSFEVFLKRIRDCKNSHPFHNRDSVLRKIPKEWGEFE